MSTFSKNYLALGLAVLLIISLSFHSILFVALKDYYTKFRLATVFPTHEDFYQSANASLPPKTQTRVILFGDSRIQQWQNLPQLEGIEFINRGIGGETTAQLRARLQSDVLALTPDIVILQLGINDLVSLEVLTSYEQAIVRQCRDNLQFIVETLLNKEIKVILLSIVPPTKPDLARLLVWNERIPELVEQINHDWLNLSATEKLQVIDTAKILQSAPGQWHENVNKDTLHLTATGYHLLNQAIINSLKK